jgi:hypothetical protein
VALEKRPPGKEFRRDVSARRNLPEILDDSAGIEKEAAKTAAPFPDCYLFALLRRRRY